ncbi:zinc-binding alcohol dehydrogenase family protein [Lactobacillus selangorensis]|nr:zinc-binding alcohol dehydrogenase family protein [Lactobacillus selangorensis]
MKAIGFYQGLPIDQPEAMLDLELPKPKAEGHDLLIKVLGVSVNPVDTKMRQDAPQTTTPQILGFDAVGVVAEKGAAVEQFEVGDRVYYAGSNQRPGSDEQYQLVDARLVSLAPDKLSVAQAAAMPLTSLTAYELLFDKLHFQRDRKQNVGQSLLVINGAGGVGSILIQLAKWAGLTVLATCSPKNDGWVKKMGADYTLDYHQDLKQQLAGLGYKQVDAIVILHSTADYFDLAADLIRPFGHVAGIVGTPNALPLTKLKDKAASFDWEFMFTKSKYHFQMATQGEALQFLARLFDAGLLQSTLMENIDSGINAENIRRAHQLVESNRMVGKVVVTGDFNGGK